MSVEQEARARIENAGYVRAFYELAALMGLNARAASPREVWENEMRPRLAALFRSSASRDEVLEEAAKVAEAKWRYYQETARKSGRDFHDGQENAAANILGAIRNLKSGALHE